MRLIFLLIGLLFFGCKTTQINTDYTIDFSDITIVGDCGTYIHKSKITNKPLDGRYKVVSNRKIYSITKFKNGITQYKKRYNRNRILDRIEQLKSDSSIHVQYNHKYALSPWVDSKPYDSIQEYRTKHYENYPTKVIIFYEGNRCQYTFDYDDPGTLKTVVTGGCELEYNSLRQTILNTK